MGGDTPENRARFLATIPLGRFSTAEDLGNAAAFLCSNEASMITAAPWRWTAACASGRFCQFSAAVRPIDAYRAKGDH